MTDTTKALKTWPERIWLVHGDDNLTYPGLSEELCWSPSKVELNDVEYVRADLAVSRATAAQEVSDEQIIEAAHRALGTGEVRLTWHKPGEGEKPTDVARCFARALLAAAPKVPDAVVYPPDGTVSPFTVINLGMGQVQMGDCIHDHRLPALWFGKNGKGMGHEEDLNREAHDGETLAVVTFLNVEGLDVLLEVLGRVRRKAFPAAAPSAPQAEGNGWISVHERLPEAGKNVLAWFSNEFGNGRTTRAYYAPYRKLDATHWEDGYDEDVDGNTAWVPQGWWESPVEGEECYPLGDKITFWMPLPPPPIAAAPMPKGEE